MCQIHFINKQKSGTLYLQACDYQFMSKHHSQGMKIKFLQFFNESIFDMLNFETSTAKACYGRLNQSTSSSLFPKI